MPDDLILVAVLVLLVLGVGISLFTRRGSGIERHPNDPAPPPPR